MNRKTKSAHNVTVNEVVICLVFFIIAGFGLIAMHISNVDIIDKSEAKEITASFENYNYSSSKSGYIHYIDLGFSDAETMRIDSSLASWELIKLIKEIDKGTQLHMLVDDSRNLIMDLRTDKIVFINFEDARYDMKSDKTGLAVLGIIIVAGGVLSLLYVSRKKQKCLKGQNEINDMINPV
ncbi:MAG: hypothetical protein IKW03_04165 [Clostridia bacterium]|nr:hypothetical protein [Clostridia bacterium]